jgi:hypothetical protein
MDSLKSSRMQDTIKMVIDLFFLSDEAGRKPLHPVSVSEALYNLEALSMGEGEIKGHPADALL